jgi:hypothetical protein
MPSRTVAVGQTCGAQVTADMNGHHADAGQHLGKSDLEVLRTGER